MVATLTTMSARLTLRVTATHGGGGSACSPVPRASGSWLPVSCLIKDVPAPSSGPVPILAL